MEITDVFLLEPLSWKREFVKLHFIRQDKILNVHTLNLSGLWNKRPLYIIKWTEHNLVFSPHNPKFIQSLSHSSK